MPLPPTAPPSPASTPLFYGARHHVFEVTLHEPNGSTPQVPEALLQDLWHSLRFDRSALATCDGTPVTILDPGTLNTDSGPDFLGARLRIGEIERRGAVEIHVTSSGWFRHKHHVDPRYNDVILHVALHADVWTGSLLRPDRSPIPEVILYPHLGASLRRLLHQFYTRPADEIPCASHWTSVPETLRQSTIQDLAVERLHAKKDRLGATYLHTPDVRALLHERLFAGLGYAKNTDAMTTLARRLPPSLVDRLGDPLDLEALHLGTAGLLPTPADLLQADRATADYAMALRDRFERLQDRYARPVMDRTAWRFFRLRPANFPPLRIAQGAAWFQPGGLLHTDPIGRLVDALQATDPVQALRRVLGVRPGPFWETHIRLDRATRPRNPALGRARLDALIVNAVAPALLLHAEQTDDPALEARVFDVLHRLPADQDEITRRFLALGTRPRDALHAQGLHHLYRTYCTPSHCLRCRIGQRLLGRV